MNFKQAFVNYQNVLDFYCFVKTYKHDLIDYQQKIELLFDLNETFLSTKSTFGQKHVRFLKLRMYHKELLDKLTEVFLRSR